MYIMNNVKLSTTREGEVWLHSVKPVDPLLIVQCIDNSDRKLISLVKATNSFEI